MSKKVEESVVEEPQIEEPVDDEGEESDEYDNIEVSSPFCYHVHISPLL